jgi:hypothetical protein
MIDADAEDVLELRAADDEAAGRGGLLVQARYSARRRSIG